MRRSEPLPVEIRLGPDPSAAAVTAADLGAVERHLRTLTGSERLSAGTPVASYPMRSPWWSLVFAAALCAEWTLAQLRVAR